MAAPDSSSPTRFIGKSLNEGRYVVSGVLGEGSQGATLEGIDKRDGTLVAIKRFQIRGARSWKDVELAEREARVLKRLSHEQLPSAIAHFEEDGALYLVMERIEGETLAHVEQFHRDDVIRFLHDADRVLHYLHTQSPPVIHRDIKPSNVIRRTSATGATTHVLVDFGSVRDNLAPRGSTVVGTFGYMAPEQFQGRARPQSDVYAVGATALAMLTGTEPEDLPHRGLAIDVRAALPDDEVMAHVLEKLVDPNPDTRPSRILPLLDDLQRRSPAPPPREAPPKRRESKRERKRRRRDERRARRTPFPPLLVPLFVIGLAIARIAVSIALRVVVPVVLTLLSLVIGPALKRAARAVSDAGVRADHALTRAVARVTGRAESPKPRVEVDDPVRVAIDDSMRDVDEEVNAALEEVAQEIEALRPKKRKR